jgi:hypothetical protein
MPALTMVARRLANSLSTKFANSSPAIQAGVQSFFCSDSAQLLLLTALATISVSALRCSAVMPGAAYTPRQLPISTLMPCSLSVGTAEFLRRWPEVTAMGVIFLVAMYSAISL